MPLLGTREQAGLAVERFNEASAVQYRRVTPKKTREIEVKQYIRKVGILGEGAELRLSMQIKITPSGSIKPGEILEILTESFQLPVDARKATIHRSALLGQGKPLIELV